MKFADTTVMVTGAGGNLGRAVASYFSTQGANLVLVDINESSLESAFGSQNERQLFAPVDLLDEAATGSMVAAAVQRFGSIDVLCNLAGGFRMGTPVHETPSREWDFLFDINVRSLLNCARAVVPGMLGQKKGKIVNVAAMSALKAQAHMGAYCASKDAVIRITEAMAAELRDNNIHVNCVMPSIIDTPENRAAMPGADASRWVSPDALARVIGFLASADSAAIHGAAIPVSGRV